MNEAPTWTGVLHAGIHGFFARRSSVPTRASLRRRGHARRLRHPLRQHHPLPNGVDARAQGGARRLGAVRLLPLRLRPRPGGAYPAGRLRRRRRRAGQRGAHSRPGAVRPRADPCGRRHADRPRRRAHGHHRGHARLGGLSAAARSVWSSSTRTSTRRPTSAARSSPTAPRSRGRSTSTQFAPGNAAIVGVHGPANPREERRWADEHRVRVFSMAEIERRGIVEVTREAMAIAWRETGGVYVSIDIDCLDAAYNTRRRSGAGRAHQPRAVRCLARGRRRRLQHFRRRGGGAPIRPRRHHRNDGLPSDPRSARRGRRTPRRGALIISRQSV